jgi:hypothetical protein
MMKSPSECIAPFEEDRQTGLVQTVPAGGVVAVGVGVAVVAVGDTVGLEADADGDAVVDVVGGLVAEADGLVVLGGGVAATSLSTVKVARRTEVARCDHVRTAVIRCRPSTSFAVSKGIADPSLAVPAKSKGALNSVRTGVPDFDESSR